MKYKGEYTADDLRCVINNSGGIRAAAREIGESATESGIRMFLKRAGDTATTEVVKPYAAGIVTAPDARRPKLEGKRFVFTSAQNNTYINEDFFASLLQFCQHRGAELFVSKFTYNKSGFQNNTKDDDGLWYDPRLKDFFLNHSVAVADDLIFCGELDILPTAGNPLSGFEGYCQGASGIVPHAKTAMQSLARMKGEDPRFLFTTGAITLRNYIQRKAGQKADFHHTYAALYVEVDEDGEWFARQLVADSKGHFYDLTEKFTPNGTETDVAVLAVNWGDIHAEKADEHVYEGAWGDRGSILQTLKPAYQFIHDLSDFSARNHHNIKDKFFLAKMYHQDTQLVEENLAEAAHFLAYITRFGNLAIIVESNHDLAFHKWLREADISFDPPNAEYFHRMNARVFQAIRERTDRFSIYEFALSEFGLLDPTLVRFLREDDSFVIGQDWEKYFETGEQVGGIECGMHGHLGPNGSRGSAKNLRTIGRKVNLGHSHSAGIIDGAYSAGVSGKLDMGYNKGPSSWSQSHIVTYHNGKRAIITMRGQKWRA